MDDTSEIGNQFNNNLTRRSDGETRIKINSARSNSNSKKRK